MRNAGYLYPGDWVKEKDTTHKHIILIGGYSKGWPQPFDPRTLSGKRIRKIMNELDLGARISFLDLWNDLAEERKGFIDARTRETIKNLFQAGNNILIPLGKYNERRLKEAGFYFSSLPHPATRRKGQLTILKKGLKKRAQENN